ncbi:2-oxo-4-hydroxy-4-carboxy-5-ureidoimidazoline decarboxylase [Mesobacillus foraminis]|uniref:2-oxo-4-hydroxy-4-carboxy-5-ureidoimidazoline decarboxylase n=1 Tax=Mesobacillus foraminis TaxID=279826 RepID=UPI0039A0C598
MSKSEFTDALGWVYEHSPWVAERAWCCKPFKSIEHLQQTMALIVQSAAESEQLHLIKAHPDLAARIDMADASVKEQTAAGLNTLTSEEYIEFLQLNQNYKDKFGFPFIIAVKGLNKHLIKEAMQQRIQLNEKSEKAEAIKQINCIAQNRLSDFINNN